MSHRNCETDPCQLCRRRQRGETCGSCYAGIVLREVALANGNPATVVERCSVCDLFETNDDAADATRLLLQLLHKVYKRGLRLGSFTVADAAEVLRGDVLNAPVLRARATRALGRNAHPNAVDHHRLLIDFASDVLKGASS